MMKHHKLLPALGIALALSGCATTQAPLSGDAQFSPADLRVNLPAAEQALSGAKSCCADLRSLDYRPLSDGYARLDADTPVYAFEQGASHYLAFELPLDQGGFTVDLRSLAGETVLAPTVMLLDTQFNVTRVLGEESVNYQPAKLVDSDSLAVSFHVDRSQMNHPGNERYLVIYTTDAQRSGSTTLIHPAKAYAKATGVEPPAIADPVAQHAPQGIIDLDISWDLQRTDQVNDYRPQAVAVPAPVEPASPATSVAPAAMFEESEQFYNDQITAAVTAGDIDKAMRLVEEAERAGSTSARQAFIDAVKGR